MPNRFFATILLLLCSMDCMADQTYMRSFDFSSCTEWSITTDIVAYENPEYLAARAKVTESNSQESGWGVYEASNNKSAEKLQFGVCRFIETSSDEPRKFQCQKYGNFPLSGSTFTYKASAYRCTESCGNQIQIIYKETSENDELIASLKKFGKKCQSK